MSGFDVGFSGGKKNRAWFSEFFLHAYSSNKECENERTFWWIHMWNWAAAGTKRVTVHTGWTIWVACWAYHAKNSSLNTLLKHSSPSMVHYIFENFDSKTVLTSTGLNTIASVATTLRLPSSTFQNSWLGSELVTLCQCSMSLRKYTLRKSRSHGEKRNKPQPGPFGCKSFQKCGVPCSGMHILSGCTTMNFEHPCSKLLVVTKE